MARTTKKAETKEVKTKKTTTKTAKQIETKPSEAYARLKEIAQLHPTATPTMLKVFAQADAEVVEILDGYIAKGLGNDIVEF